MNKIKAILISLLLFASVGRSQSQFIKKFYGAGTPGSILQSRLGDIYLNTSTYTSYICSDIASYCSGVGQGEWLAASSVTFRGAWSSVTSYIINDIVTIAGSSYIATANNSNSEPPSANWSILAEKGGPGDQGVQGIPGNDGATGATGPSGNHRYHGVGAPSSGLGSDGDEYEDDNTGGVYDKSGGAWTFTRYRYSAGVNLPPGVDPAIISQNQTPPSEPTYDLNGVDITPCTGPSDVYQQLYFNSSDSGRLYSVDCAGTNTKYVIATDIIAVTKGGIGLTALPSANYLLGVNSGATAYEGKQLIAGTNMTITHGSGTITFDSAGGGGSTTGLYSGVLDFSAIADGTCKELTFTGTGATTTMTLAAGWNILPTGILANAFVSAADTIKIRLCNLSGASYDPASTTYYARNLDSLGYFTASNTINPSALSDGNCANVGTITLSGAVTTDNIAPGWPSTLNSGIFGNMYVSATDTVTVRLCNLSGASVDVASSTFKAAITR